MEEPGTGWVNQANGVTLSSHRDKRNAIAEGRQLARAHGTPLAIHRRDGTVMQTHSYTPPEL